MGKCHVLVHKQVVVLSCFAFMGITALRRVVIVITEPKNAPSSPDLFSMGKRFIFSIPFLDLGLFISTPQAQHALFDAPVRIL